MICCMACGCDCDAADELLHEATQLLKEVQAGLCEKLQDGVGADDCLAEKRPQPCVYCRIRAFLDRVVET